VDRPGHQGRHHLTGPVVAAPAPPSGPAAPPGAGRSVAPGAAQLAAAGPRGRRLPIEPWTLVHLLSLVLGAAVVWVANRDQWFVADDWEFIVNRGPREQRLGLFTPHNEHWSTIPILIYRGLLAVVGLRSYGAFVAVLIAFHLALAHLLWRVSRRAGATPAVATGVAAVFAVLGAGAENLLWAFQIGFVGCITFGWAAVLLHDHDGRFSRRDVLGWVASVAALMTSGPGIVMVGVATLAVALRRRRVVDTLLTALVPVAVFGTWWLLVGRDAHRGAADSDAGPGELAEWAWRGLTYAAEQVTGLPVESMVAGGVALGLLAAWWVFHPRLAVGRGAPAVAGMAGAVAFYLTTASGRVSLGIDASTAGRYVYIAAALLLPAVAVALSSAVPRVAPWNAVATVAVLALCVVVGAHNVDLMRERARLDRAGDQAFEDRVLAAGVVLDGGAPLLPGWLDEATSPDLTNEALARIVGYGWLPDPGLAPETILTARAPLQTEIRTIGPSRGELGTPSVTAPVTMTGYNVAFAADESGRCTRVSLTGPDGTVTFATDGPELRMRGESLPGPPSGLALSLSRDGVAGEPYPTWVEPQQEFEIVSLAAGHQVTITIPPPGLWLCGVTVAA
jgi:hypothetical protein